MSSTVRRFDKIQRGVNADEFLPDSRRGERAISALTYLREGRGQNPPCLFVIFLRTFQTGTTGP